MKILDTTLRDGSYVIDFQFTAAQTYEIAKKLDEVGFPFIEIGHGLGLGATSRSDLKGGATDEEWLDCASAAVTRGKWGAFFIPGIGDYKDIDLACRYGMDFIRIGANVDSYERAGPYVRYAKEKGLFVCANFMKTYALPYEAVGRTAAMASSYGADLNCIVDSAGAMLPHDVEGYVAAIRNETDKLIGFHGHNNLGLANINSIRAFELGVDVIDASLRGMARSAGNTVTEMLLLAINRMGFDLGYDIFQVMDISERYVDSLTAGYRQVDSESILSGYAKFHSSFAPVVHKVAGKYGIDSRKLIVELCKIDCVNAREELVEQVAKSIGEAR
jgi:4-hydroxy 2-oxovalerate aldolase